MSDARRAHVGRSRAEKSQYYDTRVKRQIEPTFEESPFDQDSTERSVAPLPRPSQPRPAEFGAKFWHEHWVKVVGGIVATAVVTALCWAMGQCYSLNREVGELKEMIQTLRDAKQDFQRQLDRMTDRLDRLPVPAKTK